MKNRIFYTILFLAFSNILIGQILVKEGAKWSIGINNWGHYSSIFYKLEGDTIHEGKNYKRLWYAEDSLCQNWQQSAIWMRETTDGKVYSHAIGWESEILNHDFSLEVNDTFYRQNLSMFDSCAFRVAAIDSIELLDGTLRKRWKFIELIYESEFYQIEGIGNTYGLFDLYSQFCAQDVETMSLLCYSENDEMLFQDETEENCFITVSTTEQGILSKNLKIYPNPTSNFLNIFLENSDNSQPFNLKLFDFTGKEIQSFKNILPNTSFQINVKDLPRSTYLLQIIQNETFTIEKIILN